MLWRLTWLVGAVVSLGVFRLRSRGRDRLPVDGPYLLLPNHTSLFDPLWTAWPVWRPVRFVASERLFRVPGLSWILLAIGCLSRKKFVSDGRSVLAIQRALVRGDIVLMFPEGSRTWDGRTLPVLQGLGRMIRALRVPVVFARVTTGHHVQPRWADYPRWVPVRVEYDGPYTFDGQDPEAIEAEAQRRITVDAEAPPPPGSFGWRMAHGLPQYLWACPHCFALGGLIVHPCSGDAVRCTACGASWDVDVAQRLLPRDDSAAHAEPTTVPRAAAALRAHFADEEGRPVADPEARRTRGVYLEGDGTVAAVSEDGARTVLARGRLVLGEPHLEVRVDDEVRWRADLADISGLSLEVGSLLQLRVAGALHEIEVGEPGPVAWEYFLNGTDTPGSSAGSPAGPRTSRSVS